MACGPDSTLDRRHAHSARGFQIGTKVVEGNARLRLHAELEAATGMKLT